MGEGLHATVTTLAEIREYGRNTGLLPGKLNAQDWQAALNLMKTHQMIELPGAILNVEDQTPIYIYGTVNIFCSSTADPMSWYSVIGTMQKKKRRKEKWQVKQAKKIFTRMCLNNWGGINHKILEFHEYVNLFSGKSGSGKSTVMDAIQVVLYGSFSPSFLNKAADDAKNRRSVLSYLRGRTKGRARRTVNGRISVPRSCWSCKTPGQNSMSAWELLLKCVKTTLKYGNLFISATWEKFRRADI